jgi:hypothetical protein
MKISLMAILSLFLCVGVFAQEMVWSKTMGGASTDVAYRVAVDANGNVYTLGDFRGTVDFDPGAGVFNVTSAGSSDIYLQKLDANGNFLWCQTIGGANYDSSEDIAIDANGNIYTIGLFEGTIDFDAGAGVSNLTSVSGNDIYIQKLDSNGNFIWVKRIGGAASVDDTSLDVDSNGNVYTTGSFRGIVDLDPGVITFDFISGPWWDIFIQKLDSNGNFVWAKTIGGQDIDSPNDIEIDANNNIHIVGYFTETVDFDPGPGVFNLTCVGAGVGGDDAFILKLDENGNFMWARDIGSLTAHTISAIANGVTVDADGNVYTTGDFSSTVDFNPGAGVFTLTAGGTRDMFVQKLDVNGNFLWAKQMGQPGGQWLGATEGDKLAVDADKNVYITGSFRQTADFDPGPDLLLFTSVSYNDGFIQKLDMNGNLIWAKQIGGNNGDGGYDIVVDSNNMIYTVGVFRETVDFDLGSGVFNVTSAGDGDAYVLKLDQCGSNSIETISTCNSYTWIDGNTYTTSTKTGRHTYTNAAGCDSIVSLDLTINTVNTLMFLLGNTLRTTNSGAAYQWIDCINNTIIVGATNQFFTPTANGSYAVIITDNNNCTDTSNCISVVVSGIDDLQSSLAAKVYPNPTKDYLTVEFSQHKEAIQIQIVDVNGRLVLDQNYQADNKIELSVHDLVAGVYFVKIRSKEEMQIVKIIKES